MRRPLFILTTAALVAAPALRAQIPDHFTNLKVLPDTISRAALIEQMRQFSFALNVRCSYCHEVSDGLNEPADDFASDNKTTKQRARVMLRMVRDINEQYLPRLPDRRQPEMHVRCTTCHGGLHRPEGLDDLLFRLVTDSGVDTAMARYAQLRERYYGTRAYDFGLRTRFSLGERLVESGRPDAALPVIQSILDEQPTSVEAWVGLAEARVAAGDTVGGLAAYQRVVELAPNGGWARRAARRRAELTRQQ